jgi:hypothetical protein
MFFTVVGLRFLSLIIFSTLVDYIVGLTLAGTDNAKKRKMLLGVSIVVISWAAGVL